MTLVNSSSLRISAIQNFDRMISGRFGQFFDGNALNPRLKKPLRNAHKKFDCSAISNTTQKRQNGPKTAQFPCSQLDSPARSPSRPQSAHQLRPGDIDVVGAIGDSLTAGFGVEVDSLLALLHEARGSSFSIGKHTFPFKPIPPKHRHRPAGGAGTWRTHLTLPNILKNFNPRIYGYSLNAITTDSKSKFNVAEGGAISSNMPFMARVLVDRIKRDQNVDLENDWKVPKSLG